MFSSYIVDLFGTTFLLQNSKYNVLSQFCQLFSCLKYCYVSIRMASFIVKLCIYASRYMLCLKQREQHYCHVCNTNLQSLRKGSLFFLLPNCHSLAHQSSLHSLFPGSIRACKKAALECDEAKFEQYKVAAGDRITAEIIQSVESLRRLEDQRASKKKNLSPLLFLFRSLCP